MVDNCNLRRIVIFLSIRDKFMQNALKLSISLLLINCSLAYAYGGIHDVQQYERYDGTVVEEHLSGNPGSGIHCHHNICE